MSILPERFADVDCGINENFSSEFEPPCEPLTAFAGTVSWYCAFATSDCLMATTSLFADIDAEIGTLVFYF